MAKSDRSAPRVRFFADHHVITQPNPLRSAVRRVAEDVAAGDDPVARADKAMARLSVEFPKWMAAECDRLAAAAKAAMDRDPAGVETMSELFRAAHDIKGDAATFGYPAAGAIADSLCRIVEHAPVIDAIAARLIGYHVEAIQAIVREQPRGELAGVPSELNQRLRVAAEDYLETIGRERAGALKEIVAPGIVPAR